MNRYQNPVFIAGMPRSGTTLLHAILCKLGPYFPMPETHFFSNAAYGMPDRNLSPKNLKKIRRVLRKRARIEIDEQFPPELNSKKDFFEYVIAKFNRQQADTFLEKTPRHVFFYDEIMRSYPGAKFILMIREPKNVISSQLTYTHKSDKSVIRLSMLFNKIANAIVALRNHPNVRVIRYEELTDDTEAILRELCLFLSLPYDPGVLENVAAPPEIITKDAYWQERNLGLNKIKKNDPQKWRKFLNDGQANIVNFFTSRTAAAFGYSLNYVWKGFIQGCLQDISKLVKQKEFKKLFHKEHG
ncbi:MAG: sulfotransferase [Deltaproteobacteria bacterium]|jgi:hypothetical protein|nr:sulfotransferase [Deltaproteobacteria bacterium]